MRLIFIIYRYNLKDIYKWINIFISYYQCSLKLAVNIDLNNWLTSIKSKDNKPCRHYPTLPQPYEIKINTPWYGQARTHGCGHEAMITQKQMAVADQKIDFPHQNIQQMQALSTQKDRTRVLLETLFFFGDFLKTTCISSWFGSFCHLTLNIIVFQYCWSL